VQVVFEEQVPQLGITLQGSQIIPVIVKPIRHWVQVEFELQVLHPVMKLLQASQLAPEGRRMKLEFEQLVQLVDVVLEVHEGQLAITELQGTQTVPEMAKPVEHTVHAPIDDPRQVTQLALLLQQARTKESLTFPGVQVAQAQKEIPKMRIFDAGL
jgi:hypothetical protein